MDGHPTHPALARLRAAVDALLSAELGALPGVEVAGLLAELETQRRRLEAVDARLIAEVSQRGLAGEYGRTGPADLLVSSLRVTPGEAQARVARAQDLGPRRGLTGEPLPPLLAVTAAAVRAGQLSPGHVTVIASCLDRIPSTIAYEAAPVAERLLVEAAGHEHPRQLARTAQLLLARLDPDGVEAADDDIQRRCGYSLVKHADGSSTPRGHWSPELTAMWEAILDSLAAPNPSAELPDQRSPARRRHDAMAEAAARLLRSGSLPASGGAPVTILARTRMTELADRAGVAVTGHGAQLSISTLLQLAADAHVIPVICNDTGAILAYGRTRRLASSEQRRALAARDGGCCFPGCDRPAAWTEAHHVRDWIDGGETNIDQMCLLCRFHHRHFAKHDWDVVMTNGVPHWLPPPWIDPDRKPIRNTAHHLSDFDFTTGHAA